jgi:hypothetical protein
MMALHAKDYYLAPMYPVIFAAGGVAFFSARAGRMRWQPAYAGVLLLTGVLVLPAAIPVLTPERQLAYLNTMHLHSPPSEKWAEGPMPQFFSDRFGWQEMANAATRAYDSLSAADRAQAGIFAGNYGEAGAINFLAPRADDGSPLPAVVSGQNNYYLWGPHGYSGEVMVLVVHATPEQVREVYSDVTVVATVDNPWSVPYEHVTVYVCRHRKSNFSAAWPQMKDYI